MKKTAIYDKQYSSQSDEQIKAYLQQIQATKLKIDGLQLKIRDEKNRRNFIADINAVQANQTNSVNEQHSQGSSRSSKKARRSSYIDQSPNQEKSKKDSKNNESICSSSFIFQEFSAIENFMQHIVKDQIHNERHIQQNNLSTRKDFYYPANFKKRDNNTTLREREHSQQINKKIEQYIDKALEISQTRKRTTKIFLPDQATRVDQYAQPSYLKKQRQIIRNQIVKEKEMQQLEQKLNKNDKYWTKFNKLYDRFSNLQKKYEIQNYNTTNYREQAKQAIQNRENQQQGQANYIIPIKQRRHEICKQIFTAESKNYNRALQRMKKEQSKCASLLNSLKETAIFQKSHKFK